MEESLSKLPNDVIRSALSEAVENQLKSKNYNSISIDSAMKAGDSNFLGIIYRASFKEQNEDKIHKMIVKVAPQHQDRKIILRPGFLREIYMYEKVLPTLRQFKQSKWSGSEIDLDVYAKCFRTVDMEFSECLLLEDLCVRGFRMFDNKTETITVEHINLLIKHLAQLHAVSFAMKDQTPKQFQELVSSMDEVCLGREEQIQRDYFAYLGKYMEKLVSREEDAHLLARVKKLLEVHPMDVACNCIDSNRTNCAVISHGDTWVYNLMFRHDDNGKPVEINLVDWQLARYSSPVIDILYFMFICTTKKFRDAHYDEFLNLYHKHLSLNIQRLGSDPDKLFSYEMMLEEFRKFGRFGLITASGVLPFMLKDHAQDLEKLDNNNPNNKIRIENALDTLFASKKSRNAFEIRLRDIIVDMVRLGYI